MAPRRFPVSRFRRGGSIPQAERTGQKTDRLEPVRDEAKNPCRSDTPKEQEVNDHEHTDEHRPVLEGDLVYFVFGTVPIENDEVTQLSAPTPSLFGTPDDVL